ncbi:MAG: HAMP domain-containing protein [Burkholderiales bacterium]|uniref:ATP-binding protein n=1 Tax=Roseateles sp. TaxID=1971397 RepID=UPI000FAAF3EF|nr:MAG: HAMP domain-containing protein [Burkholderiales bacterium]
MSLASRIAGLLGAALLLAYGLASLAWLDDRLDAMGRMMHAYVGRDAATALAVLDRLPAAERAAWLARLARPNYRYELAAPPADLASTESAMALAHTLAGEVGAGRIKTYGVRPDGELAFALTLADGSPLTLRVRPPLLLLSPATLGLLAAQIAVLALCGAAAARLATRPLRRLADAAERLGADPDAAPLPEAGPRELASAARAFNTMQARIQAHLRERSQILAAITHDLQTPLTRMRLRSELLAEAQAREKLLADIDEMHSLVAEGLSYAASAHAAEEAAQPVDLAALLDGLVCDAQDAGHAVRLDAPAVISAFRTKPRALRRIVGNLLDNAVKFAGGAELVVRPGNDHVLIAVLDRGPGIPAEQLQAVLQPYVRLETSRNRDSGGTGLGLAIAQRLAQALGATLELRLRAGGGLEARLSLPA